jgi:PAS domain S-box-containing protein
MVADTDLQPSGQELPHERVAALHDIALALVHHLDPAELLEDILNRAAALVGTAHGCIDLVEAGASTTRDHKSIGVFTQYKAAVRYGEGIMGRAWESSQILVVDNYAIWPDRLPLAVLDELRATIAVPLKSGEQITAVLVLAHVEEGRVFDRAQIEALRLFAELASIVLDKARFHAALRASEARFRAAVEGSLDAFFVFQCERDETGQIIDFRMVDANRNAEKLLSGARADMIGKRICEHLPAHQRDIFLEKYRRVFETGAALEEELYVSVPRLEGRWLHHQIVPLTDGIAITVRDITERKQAEGALARSNTELDRQKEMLDAILSATPDHIILFDLDRRYVYVNKPGLESVGMSLADVVGKTWRELGFPVDVGEAFEQQFDEILRTGVPIRSEVEFPSVRGPRHYESIHTPIRDNNGQIISLVATQRDITERRAIETAERDQRVFIEALRDTAATITSTLELDEVMNRILENVGRVVPHDCANIMLIDGNCARAVYWRNYPADYEPFLKRYCMPLDLPGMPEFIASAGPLVIPDTALAAGWGSEPESRWVRSFATAPLRTHGQLIGFLNLDSATPNFFSVKHAGRLQAFADQAAVAIENAQLYAQIRHYATGLEQRVAERTAELTAANARLRDLDQVKSKFVQDISHELRTPIANLNLRLHLMERDRSGNQAEHLAALRRYTDQLMVLTSSILEFLQLGLGEAEVTFGPVDLNSIVEQAITAEELHAAATGLRLRAVLDPALPPVWGEPNQLARAVSNLLANAINYTPAGEVRISTGYEQDHVTLVVQDTGTGIQAEELPYVFEHFYRGASVGQLSMPGAGLGLGVVKQIVESHSGRIEVESQAGKGSAFKVWLPTAKSAV